MNFRVRNIYLGISLFFVQSSQCQNVATSRPRTMSKMNKALPVCRQRTITFMNKFHPVAISSKDGSIWLWRNSLRRSTSFSLWINRACLKNRVWTQRNGRILNDWGRLLLLFRIENRNQGWTPRSTLLPVRLNRTKR